jgi:outer membrane protein OmpA-like peptidoglycan-associated protein
VNYRHRSGATKVDFRGTALMPQAKGSAKVGSKQGYMEVDAHFDDLTPASQFGPEYMTYVLWAITPEGRPKNLGEVVLNGNNSSLDVTTEMQAFGLIVTAEPYFAVTQPSDVVVMENFIRNDTKGQWEVVDAKYDLLPRGQYRYDPHLWEKPVATLDTSQTPLEMFEAQNAISIAQSAGADKYAQDTISKAQADMQKAQGYIARKERKPAIMMAREAAQNAEDARLLSLKRAQDEALANERQAASDREARARAQAEQAEQARLQAENEAQRAARERADAEQARAAALAQQQQAQEEAEKARQAADDAERLRQQAEHQQAEMRQRLQQQLNQVLETRATARGLIMNMSDVLFDFGKYTLRPEAREKLAKIAGILLAHPDLTLQVEGYTDNIGSDGFNQSLSEKRAEGVRDYLEQQGVKDVSARGFGKANPVASNATAEGRQQNRRVEMVVAGASIGTQPSAPPSGQ